MQYSNRVTREQETNRLILPPIATNGLPQETRSGKRQSHARHGSVPGVTKSQDRRRSVPAVTQSHDRRRSVPAVTQSHDRRRSVAGVTETHDRRRSNPSLRVDERKIKVKETRRKTWDTDTKPNSRRASVNILPDLVNNEHVPRNGAAGVVDKPGVWGPMRILKIDEDANTMDSDLIYAHTSAVNRNNILDNKRSMKDNDMLNLVDNLTSNTHRRNSINRLAQPKVRDGGANNNAEPTNQNVDTQHMAASQPIRNNQTTAIEEFYLSKMRSIIYQKLTDAVDRPSPTKILDYLYIGSYWDANNPQYLQRLGITHVLNCTANQSNPDRCPYHADTGILWYEGLPAIDKETYDILQHVDAANTFINKAMTGGKVLVHCTMGVNRSVVLVACYMIGVLKMTLLHTVKTLKERRGTVLRNVGFQRQLVTYAKRKGQL